MAVVLREDDGLAELVAVVDFQPVFHQDVQDFPNGVFVEQPLVQRGGRDPFRQLPVLVRESILVNPLLLFGKLVVGDALLDEFQRRFHRQKIDKKTILHRLRQLVAIRRHAVLQFKNGVGILVDVVLRRRGQPHQRRVEIIENVLVLVVDGPMGLVANHEVEMTAGKQLSLFVAHRVDAVHHRLIRGKNAVGRVVVLLLAKIRHGKLRQQIDEAPLRLRHQRIAVSQKQDILRPALFQKRLAQCDDRPRLAAARGHDQQSFSAVLLAEALADGFHGSRLIISARNLLIDDDVLQVGAHGRKIHQLFEVALGVDGGDFPLRILIVRDAGIESVAQEYHRTAALLLFDNIRVQLRLLPPFGNVHAGALRLDYRKDAPVVAQQHIIGIPDFGLVRHTGKLVFVDPVLSFHPAGVFQHRVDIEFARLVFGDFQRLCHIGLPLLLAPRGQLFPKRRVLFHQLFKFQFRFGFACRRFGRRFLLQQRGVKGPFLIVAAVAISDEIEEDIEIFQAQRGLFLRDLPADVGGGVPRQADIIQPPQQIVVHDISEILGIHQADQLILIRRIQRVIHRIHPFHGALHRPAAVHHAGRRVDPIDALRRHGSLRKGGEVLFFCEEVKVGHDAPPKPSPLGRGDRDSGG